MVFGWILCSEDVESGCPMHVELGFAETLSIGGRLQSLIAQYYLASLKEVEHQLSGLGARTAIELLTNIKYISSSAGV
jgi:hypothetical protein